MAERTQMGGVKSRRAGSNEARVPAARNRTQEPRSGAPWTPSLLNAVSLGTKPRWIHLQEEKPPFQKRESHAPLQKQPSCGRPGTPLLAPRLAGQGHWEQLGPSLVPTVPELGRGWLGSGRLGQTLPSARCLEISHPMWLSPQVGVLGPRMKNLGTGPAHLASVPWGKARSGAFSRWLPGPLGKQ